MRRITIAFLAASAAGFAQSAAGADLPARAAVPPSSWTGFYAGLHDGAAWGITKIPDPFGTSIYGDNIRMPGDLFGGQLGFNWQAGDAVLGAEADASLITSDGTVTCFAFSGFFNSANCRARPFIMGTVTGHAGWLLGQDRRTLVYVKGGGAVTHGKLDMTSNDPADFAVRTNYTSWGWTGGIGFERAVTSDWSWRIEYDYLNFGAINANTPYATVVGAKQDVHAFKIATNYNFASALPADSERLAAPSANAPGRGGTGWEFETGGRYWFSSGRFQKDIGLIPPAPSDALVSRLTYEDMTTHSGEYFARIETPSNIFIKGYVGGSAITNGKMTDEDWGIVVNGFVPYSNTISNGVDGSSWYGAIDAGYDWLRGAQFKVGSFIGYHYVYESMFAHGCIQVANANNDNCVPAFPTTAAGGVQEKDHWHSLRFGSAGEFMLTDRVKLAGEIAYLPYVKFYGADKHLFLGDGSIASTDRETGHGQGIQAEVLVAYALTENLNVGVGARYWAMWTTSGNTTRTVDCSSPGVCTAGPFASQLFKGAFEQAGVFAQASYKLNGP